MLKNRFLSVFALAFAAGIATPFLAGNGWEAVIFIILLVLALTIGGLYTACCFKAKELKKYLLYPTILAAGLALGAGWLCLRALPYESYASYVGMKDTVKGTVTENGSYAESKYLEITVERSRRSLPAGTKIRLYLQKEDVIIIGDEVTATLTYSSLSRNSERMASCRLVANGYVSDVKPGSGMIASLRFALAENCKALYERYGVTGVAQALTLRECSLLSGETNDAYRTMGLSHVLSISGLHLSILAMMLRKLLFALRVRKQVRESLALGMIVLYCFLTGFYPPVIRSAVMVGSVLLGEILLRETDGITLLSTALLFLLAVNPYALLSVSLQLSFLSCLGIILLEPHVTELQKKIRGNGKGKASLLRRIAAPAAGSFMISCSAVVFTFPVIAYTFGNLSWLSPITNLIFVPLFTPILTLLLVSVLVYSAVPFLGTLLAFLPGTALRLMEDLFGWFLEREIGTLYVPDAWALLPILLSCAAIGCMLLFRRKGVLLFTCFSLCGVLSLSAFALAEAFLPPDEYVFLSGEDACLYVARDGEGVFLDLGGETELPLPEGYAVKEYLVTRGDENAMLRLANALREHPITKVYLPLSDHMGGEDDLTVFLTLLEGFPCEVRFYHEVCESTLLEYNRNSGTAVTPYGLSVLTGNGCDLMSPMVWVVSPTAFGLDQLGADHLYLPVETDLTEDLPSAQLHFYHSVIIYENGEVYVP